MEQTEHVLAKKKSFFDAFSSKMAFWMGVMSSMAIVFMIGFFVLLGLFLTQDNTGKALAYNPPQPSAQAGQDPTGGSISVEPVSAADWMMGDKNAPITIIEYSDIQCPFCQRFHPTLLQIAEQYKGKVNWVYRHFPLTSIHPMAVKQAEATECAGELAGNDGFWKMLDYFFANPIQSLDELSGIASKLGFNKTKFDQCLSSGKYTQKIQDSIQKAVAAGAQGTPYSVVVAGDQQIPLSGALPVEQIQGMLDQLSK